MKYTFLEPSWHEKSCGIFIFSKAVATKFTNVHDLNLKQISLISIVIFRFLKKSLEVATALEKNEYTVMGTSGLSKISFFEIFAFLLKMQKNL